MARATLPHTERQIGNTLSIALDERRFSNMAKRLRSHMEDRHELKMQLTAARVALAAAMNFESVDVLAEKLKNTFVGPNTKDVVAENNGRVKIEPASLSELVSVGLFINQTREGWICQYQPSANNGARDDVSDAFDSEGEAVEFAIANATADLELSRCAGCGKIHTKYDRGSRPYKIEPDQSGPASDQACMKCGAPCYLLGSSGYTEGLNNLIAELEEKYCDLVSAARSGVSPDIEEAYPKESEALLGPDARWHHGFNSGMLAALRLVVDSMHRGADVALDDFPNLDT